MAPPETFQKVNGEADRYGADVVLRQIARSMVGNPDVSTVLIDHITTVKNASRAVATSLQDDDTQIILFHEQSPDERKSLRTAAPERPSPQVCNALRQIARDQPWPTQEPYVHIRSRRAERYLPCLSGSLALMGIDGNEDSPVCKILTDAIYFDTGAHVSAISDDLVDEKFLEYLRLEENKANYDSGVGKVMVDSTISFTNTRVQIPFLMYVVPQDMMPNRLSGVLLGQHTFIDRLQYESTPRAILNSRGQYVPDDIWGEIAINEYVALDGCKASQRTSKTISGK
jgi:hypothetical protein